MAELPQEKFLYSEIEKKLFYIVPERWDSIYLYASVVNKGNRKTGGEMFFYYIPKGFIKKKPINGYEIPSLFNIDEEEFSKLITDLYSMIKKLRVLCYKARHLKWSNINILIKDGKLKAEYGFEDLENSNYDSYERHLIWRYNNFEQDIDALSKKDKKIINKYLEDMRFRDEEEKVGYEEEITDIPVKNIVDFEKTLTVDEAIAQSRQKSFKTKKSIMNLFKKKDEHEINEEQIENQLLKFK